MDALDDERRSPMVAVAAWWDRHGIMGVGEGRDPKLGAWCLVPVLPLSGPAVSWRVASARHRIDGGGGVLVGTRASRRAWRDAFSNVTAQRPNAHSLPIGWRPTVQGRYAQWGPVAWHIRIKARRGHMQAPSPQIALKARIH